jgi:hypothetical protein
MGATRGTPINTDAVHIGAREISITERDVDDARCELVVERGGERWQVRVHYDGAIEPVDDPRGSPPIWVANAIRQYEFATSE